MTELKGKNYRALRRLSTAEDETLAEEGETCDRVPVQSLAPLLASGHIEPATAAERVRRQRDEGSS